MGFLSSSLDIIRGYMVVTKPSGETFNFYISDDYTYNDVRDAIVTVLTTLNISVYQDADISSEIQQIENAGWGPDIRDAIYNAVKKLIVASGLKGFANLSLIRYAHFGRDMRQPLYDIFVKLGADSDDITPYRPTTVDDYIYNIEDNNATLLYYIGNPNEYISIPSMINVEGANYSVKYLGEMLFNENSILKSIEIPESVEVIS